MAAISDREFLNIVHEATNRFRGNLDVLESAIGALAVGRAFGWKPLYIIHQRSTLQRYEKILGVQFREILVEVGPSAHKSVGWRLAQFIPNFWKAVKGEVPNVKTAEIK